MELITFGASDGYRSREYGSTGFTVTPLARVTGSVVCLRLERGGTIGRHPAVGRQLLVVVSGSGTVSNGDGAVVPISTGQAAFWTPGEEHETRSVNGLTAIVVEGPSVELLLPRG
ncbi:MAG: cupin [Pseudonocardiales bacterium]|nr:MAG: cupin [Pseudonocardiales bacterium]